MIDRITRAFTLEALQEHEPVELTECSGCGGFCGAEELSVERESFSAEPATVKMFRSWRCLIRHAIAEHELSQEPRPLVRCPECGRTASDSKDGYQCAAPVGNFHADQLRCEGILRWRWEDR